MRKILPELLLACVMLAIPVAGAKAAATIATPKAVVSDHEMQQNPLSQWSEAAGQQPRGMATQDGGDLESEKKLPQRFAEKSASYIGFAAGAAAGSAIGFAILGPVGAVVGAAVFAVAGDVVFEWIATNLFKKSGPYIPRMNRPLIPAR